jgi:flagellar motor switch protein FliN/FliY
MKIESKRASQPVDLLDLPEPGTPEAAAPVLLRDMRVLHDVPVTLEVVLGEVVTDVRTLFESKVGSLLTLDRPLAEPVEVRLNRHVVARGELVAVGDRYGVRITEVAEPR